MKRLRLVYIYICFGITRFGQPEQKSIDSLMKTYYQTSAPGAAIAIQQHHKMIFEKAYGLADLETKRPLTLNSVFNIGSLTKQFTAFAILQLLQQKN